MDTLTDYLSAHADIAFTALLLVAALVHWLAWRTRLPSILLMLATGLLIGRIGLDVFRPEAIIGEDLLFGWVSISVAIILFEGGLSLSWREFERGGRPLKGLLTVGIAVAWLGTALLAGWLLGLGLELSLLIGAILVVTGPTVVGPLLAQIKPVGRAGTIIKWEGILNDPIGAMLAVLVLEVVIARGSAAAWSGIPLTLLVAIAGTTAAGWLTARLTTWLIAREHLPDQLHGFASLALCLALFIACNLVQPESGLLAVTVYGMALANQRRVSVRHIVHFQENLRTMLIALLFIVLAARFTPEQLAMLDWRAAAFLAGLVLLVRPLAVFTATWGSDLSWRDRGFVALLAPRGIVAAAVASLFALKLRHAGIDGHAQLEPIIYTVIIGTVLIYGLGGRFAAALLGLRTSARGGVLIIGAQPWARNLASALQEADCPVHLLDRNREAVQAARMAGLEADDVSVIDARLESACELHPGIDLLLALNRSDEVNALACLRYEERFGKHRVFQIAGNPTDGQRPLQVQPSSHMHGRHALPDGVSHDAIADWFGDDARAVVTRLGSRYSFDDYLRDSNGSRLPILVLRANGEVEVMGSIKAPPVDGDRIVAFAHADGDDEIMAETVPLRSPSALIVT